MKNLKLLIGVMLCTSLFWSCNKEEQESRWSISGTVSSTDHLVPEITSPLEGVGIYLINLEATIDTVSGWYGFEDIIDSTLTNEEGQYSFVNLVPGNYRLIPVDPDGLYHFNWASDSDSVWLVKESTQTSYEINFNSQDEIKENAYYTIKIDVSYDNWEGGDVRFFLGRKARTWDFKGFGNWGIPQFGWSDWYYKPVDEMPDGLFYWLTPKPDVIVFNEEVDASWQLYQYQDAFKISVDSYVTNEQGFTSYTNRGSHYVSEFTDNFCHVKMTLTGSSIRID